MTKRRTASSTVIVRYALYFPSDDVNLRRRKKITSISAGTVVGKWKRIGRRRFQGRTVVILNTTVRQPSETRETPPRFCFLSTRPYRRNGEYRSANEFENVDVLTEVKRTASFGTINAEQRTPRRCERPRPDDNVRASCYQFRRSAGDKTVSLPTIRNWSDNNGAPVTTIIVRRYRIQDEDARPDVHRGNTWTVCRTFRGLATNCRSIS